MVMTVNRKSVYTYSYTIPKNRYITFHQKYSYDYFIIPKDFVINGEIPVITMALVV